MIQFTVDILCARHIHDAVKQEIGEVDNGILGTIIVTQCDQMIVWVLHQGAHQRRLCLTEGIDRLLDITNPEDIVFLGNTFNDSVLQFTGILEFINHDLLETVSDNLCNSTVVLGQDIKGVTLHI